MSRDGPGLLLRAIRSGDDAQVEAIVKVISHVDADVLVLGDVDYDHDGLALTALADRLGNYPHLFARAPNRGRQSGHDLDGDGRMGRADDAWGYGEFAGQGGLAILSKYPIGAAIDFTDALWSAQKDNLALPSTPPGHPLSTTAHWEVPAAFWLHRIKDAPPPNVVIAGFANLDPVDGDGRAEALNALLTHPDLSDPKPQSEGAVLAGVADVTHRGPANRAQYD